MATKQASQLSKLPPPPGSLTMVVGGAGSGKSSLLLALAGHMARREGKVEVGGRTAYVAQSAWVTNDTLQVGGRGGNGQVTVHRLSFGNWVRVWLKVHGSRGTGGTPNSSEHDALLRAGLVLARVWSAWQSQS